MHLFSEVIESSKTEAQIRESTTDVTVWALSPHYLSCLYKVEAVVIVLIHARSNSQDVQVEDDVLRRKTSIFSKDFVGTLANSDFIFDCGCLALLIEGHNDNCSSILENDGGFKQEFFFAFFKGDGVDDTLALAVLQACFDNFKL